MCKPLFLIISITLSSIAFSQKEKDNDKQVLSDKEAKSLLNQLFPDSSGFVKVAAQNACHCIDSVDKAQKDKSKKMKAFSDCIDEQVMTYQLAAKMMSSMKTSNQQININTDKSSSEYKNYYYDLERWLKDSCAILNKAIASNDEEKEKSFSENPDAMEAYNAGVKLLQKENYADGIPYFEKAVKIDPEFVFAWDNLGICYRKTGKLDKAEAAYKSSLKVDPAGRTALQNLPVVYQIQKRDDEAIAAYNNLLSYYPDDPEVYYGIALIYLGNKNDAENALKNMCKAYTIYVKQKSPFRSDAEKVINIIYAQMKKDNKEDVFNKILAENNMKSN